MPVKSFNVALTPSPSPTEVKPSLSHLDARGPSPVPTFTPSPSSAVANMPIDEDVPNLAIEDPPPLNDCPMVVAKAVTLSIRQQFGHPSPTRGSEELGRSAYIDEVFQSDVASSVGESQLSPLDPAEEQRLRSQCGVGVARPKRKGYLYGVRDLAHSYKCGNDNII
ncbi:hypothetical protein GmHk_01G001727 [Glycine max]|nr:hypothetical protein GmHk_01G001727 [Glycine max]